MRTSGNKFHVLNCRKRTLRILYQDCQFQVTPQVSAQSLSFQCYGIPSSSNNPPFRPTNSHTWMIAWADNQRFTCTLSIVSFWLFETASKVRVGYGVPSGLDEGGEEDLVPKTDFPTPPEEPQGSNPSAPPADKFEETYAELRKWADMSSPKYLMLTVKREKRAGRLGSAVKVSNTIRNKSHRLLSDNPSFKPLLSYCKPYLAPPILHFIYNNFLPLQFVIVSNVHLIGTSAMQCSWNLRPTELANARNSSIFENLQICEVDSENQEVHIMSWAQIQFKSSSKWNSSLTNKKSLGAS